LPRGRPPALSPEKLQAISLGIALTAILPDRDQKELIMLAHQLAADDCTVALVETDEHIGLSWTVPNMMENRLEYLRKQMGDPYWTDRQTAGHSRAASTAGAEMEFVAASVGHLVLLFNARDPAVVDHLCVPLSHLGWRPPTLSKVRLQAAFFALGRKGRCLRSIR
jgi:hypothetical protein